MQYLNLSKLDLKFYQHKEQIMTIICTSVSHNHRHAWRWLSIIQKKHATACLIVPFINFLKERLSLVWQLSIKYLAK